MAKWAAGEPDDLEWLQDWCSALREQVKVGKSVRRARIVSEPLSDYQRWSYSIAYPMVEAGEEIRWVPRRLVSSLALPGNDFYLLYDHLIVFFDLRGEWFGYRQGHVHRSRRHSTLPVGLRGCVETVDRPQ
jgi:hypothetical protein